MVDRDDIPRISALNTEKAMLERALGNLNTPDGRIDSMEIGGPMSAAFINTIGWQYPPQMVEAIKENLNRRLAEIAKELADLGVTGMDR